MSRFGMDAREWRELRTNLQLHRDSFNQLVANGWCVEPGNRELDEPPCLCCKYAVAGNGSWYRQVIGSGVDAHEAIRSAVTNARLSAKCPECGHPRHLPKDCPYEPPLECAGRCACTYAALAKKHGWPV